MHRAHAARMATGGTVEEALYTWQAPDVDRKIVGTFLQVAGKIGELGDGHQIAEISFDAESTFEAAAEENADDTRSSVLHYGTMKSNGDNGTAVQTTGFIPQSAEWRRGTEVFLHSKNDYAANSAVRAILYYKEDE